ncbi:MAG: alpha/beta hydrolase [Acidobacteriota bacterium]
MSLRSTFISRLVAGAAVLAILCAPGTSVQAQDYTVKIKKNIAYGPESLNKLDVYRPKELKSAPVLVFIHGGAWMSGDKSEYAELGKTFSGYHGLVTVVANYRLSPEVQHPAHVEDVAAAIRWVVKNVGRYGGDPQHVFLFGHSAGGHLVSLVATDETYLAQVGLAPSAIDGVVSASGAYDLSKLPLLVFGPAFVSAFGTTDKSVLKAASPVTYVGAGQAPLLITYAETDLPGLTSNAKSFHNLLTKKGLSSELQQLKGYDHYTEIASVNTGEPDSPMAMAVLQFVADH